MSNNKPPNTPIQQILNLQTPKTNTQQPHFTSQQPKIEDDIEQQPTKVLRNSSSQYDSVLQNFYKKQQQNDAKSTYKQGKNQRQTKQEISFIIDKSQKEVTAAYFIANKESNSGVFSHQRFFVVDLIAKEIKYYTNTPRLPLKSIEEIVDKPKECIKFSQTKKISVTNPKKAIGQLQIRWTQNSQTKEWKLKLGNNLMAKQLSILIDSIKLGKPVTIDQKSKSKQKIIKQLNSPRNKSSSLNKSWISGVKKESVVVARAGPSDLSNLLLKSMMNPNESVMEREVRKQRVKIAVPKTIQKREQDILLVKDTPKQARVDKNLKIQSFILNQNIMKPGQVKRQEQIKETAKWNEITQKLNEKQKQKQIVEQSKKQIVEQSHEPINEHIQHNQNNRRSIQKQQHNNNPIPHPQNIPQTKQNNQLKPHNNANSLKSIRLDEIIRNASIQYQEQQQQQLYQPQVIPISILQIQKPRKSQLDAVIQRRKQIEEQSTPTERTVNKQQLQMSKIIVNNISKNTSQSKTLQLSRKKSITNNKLQQSRQKNQVYYQSTATPKQPNMRQNLLQQRKYAQTVKVADKRQAKIMNTHNHPRKQRSRSNSANSKIEEYIQKQKQNKQHQKDWLLKWLTTQNSGERGLLYKKIVDQFKQKVNGLTKKFSSWHLFHKEGEQYILKEGEVQMQYVIMASEGTANWQNIENEYFRRCNQLSYLWNMTLGGKKLNKSSSSYKVIIAPTCIVTYKGLKVFCRLDLHQTKLSLRDVSYTSQYQELMTQIARKCHCKVKSIQLYELIIANKKYLYIQSIQVQPSIQEALTYYLNQVYVKTYVAGVITLQQHLQKIHNHHLKTIIPQFASLLSQFTPLSSLQLQAEMTKLGVDRSVLPLVYMYCKQKQLTRQNKYILSEVCAQVISQNIRRGIHRILLSKVAQKNIEQQIYSLLMINLRMDDRNICHTLQAKYRMSITLQEIRNNLIEQYLITSLFINMGIKCNLKEQIEMKQAQKIKELFWQQFQFNQQSASLKWESKTKHYSPIPLHHNTQYFQHLFYPIKTKQFPQRFVYDRQHILQQLAIPQAKAYNQSWFFLLLNQYHQSLLISKIAKQQPFQPAIEWHNQLLPFYHLKHQPLLYYSTYHSFVLVIIAFRILIRKGQYQNAHSLVDVQLARAWIWGSHNPKLLVSILLLKSELNQLMSNQIQSIESILQALRIAIKHHQLSSFKLLDVLKLFQKSASLHSRYRKYRKSIQFYQTSISLFQKAIQQPHNKDDLFITSISIYNQRVKIYLKLGDYVKVEECAKNNMVIYFNYKELLHDQPDILSILYRQQFQLYSLLFRVYQIRGKFIELVQLMQDCCVKYIENYLQLLVQSNSKLNLDEQQVSQYTQIIKNIWIAVIANSNHTKIPSYQQYFNYYYSPLRNIKLEVVKDILIKIRKMHKGLTPFEKEQAINHLMSMLTNKIKQNKQKQHNTQNKRAKSILMVGMIDCLSLLSISQHTILQQKNNYEPTQLLMLHQLVSILGYEFAIGILDFYSNEYSLQL